MPKDDTVAVKTCESVVQKAVEGFGVPLATNNRGSIWGALFLCEILMSVTLT